MRAFHKGVREIAESIFIIVIAFMYMLIYTEKTGLEKRLYELEKLDEETQIRNNFFKESFELIFFFLAGFIIVVKIFELIYH